MLNNLYHRKNLEWKSQFSIPDLEGNSVLNNVGQKSQFSIRKHEGHSVLNNLYHGENLGGKANFLFATMRVTLY